MLYERLKNNISLKICENVGVSTKELAILGISVSVKFDIASAFKIVYLITLFRGQDHRKAEFVLRHYYSVKTLD